MAQPAPLPVTFAIVGVQEAATSTLHAMLSRHREIARGPLKERHFFDDEQRAWVTPDYSSYHTVPTKPPQRITGDATPIYLFWPRALERMRAYDPGMRLIASFRDPIERAFSQWSMERDRNPYAADFGHAIRDPRFLELPGDDAASNQANAVRERSLIARGLYAQQLRRGFTSLDREQWLMFDFRTLISHPETVLDRVTDHLGIERYRTYPQPAKRHASRSEHRGTPPTADDIAWLADYYAPDLAGFTALSGIDVSRWPTARILAGDLGAGALAEKLARGAGLDPARGRSRSAARRPGPAWLGIGAQRSGTTWLTDLLVQHPGVGLGTNAKKEQQALHRIPTGQLRERDYLGLFPADSLLRGDFTPRYLNNTVVPAVAARLLPQEAPILAILRDPVERFASALRRRGTYAQHGWPYEATIAYSQWAGMYLAQLDLWASVVGAGRIMVFTYEAVRADPEPMCTEIWRRLGLAPIALDSIGEPSSSAAGHVDWQWPGGMRDALITLYRPQLDALAQRWGVRTDLWRTFSGGA